VAAAACACRKDPLPQLGAKRPRCCVARDAHSWPEVWSGRAVQVKTAISGSGLGHGCAPSAVVSTTNSLAACCGRSTAGPFH